MALNIVDPLLDISGDGRISVEDRMRDRAAVITSAKFVRVEGLSMSVRAGGDNHTQTTKAVREKLYADFGAPGERHVLFTDQMVQALHGFKQWLTGRVFKLTTGSDSGTVTTEDSEFSGGARFNRKVGDSYSYKAGHRFLWNATKTRNFSVGKRLSETHLDSEYYHGKKTSDYRAQRNELQQRQVELTHKLGGLLSDTSPQSQKQREAVTRALNEVNRKLWLVDDILRRNIESRSPHDIENFTLPMQENVGIARSDIQEQRTFGDSYNYHEGDTTAFRYGDKKAFIKGTAKVRIDGRADKVQVGNSLTERTKNYISVTNGSFNIVVNGIGYSEIGGVFGSEKGGMFREIVYGHNINYRFKDIYWQSYGTKVLYNYGPKNSDTFGETTNVSFVGSSTANYGDTYSYGTTSQNFTGHSIGKRLALDLGLAAAALTTSVASFGVAGLKLGLGDLFFEKSGTVVESALGPHVHIGHVNYRHHGWYNARKQKKVARGILKVKPG